MNTLEVTEITQSEVQEATQFAQQLRVIDRPGYELAMTAIKGYKELEKRIVEHHKPIKVKLDEAKKTVLEQERKLLDPTRLAIATINEKVSSWYRAEQARLDEQRRQAEEVQRKAQEAQRAAEIAHLKAQGFKDDAKALKAAPLAAVAIPVGDVAPKMSGITMRESWRAEVVSLPLLIKAIADGKVSMNLVEPNMAALNTLARALKESMQTPGVKVIKEIRPAATR